MKLNELFTIRISLGDSSVIGNGPSGLRVIAEVAGGVEGGEGFALVMMGVVAFIFLTVLVRSAVQLWGKSPAPSNAEPGD